MTTLADVATGSQGDGRILFFIAALIAIAGIAISLHSAGSPRPPR